MDSIKAAMRDYGTQQGQVAWRVRARVRCGFSEAGRDMTEPLGRTFGLAKLTGLVRSTSASVRDISDAQEFTVAMSRILAHLTLPMSRVQQTADRLKLRSGAPLGLTLRAVGSGGICAAAGPTHDVMRLIGGLAEEGEAALLTAETE